MVKKRVEHTWWTPSITLKDLNVYDVLYSLKYTRVKIKKILEV